jgi:hypothetical protein
VANTYVWQFERLDVYPTYETVTDAVQSIHWRMNADDGSGHSASAYGENATGPIDVNNFIPFASLTASVVQAWLEALLGADGVNEIKADLDRCISEAASPSIVGMATPW